MKKLQLYQAGYPGFSATFVGNGIGRFAYIALIPALIEAQWFSQKEASYLGVATLVGYLFGSLLVTLLVKLSSEKQVLRLSMLISSISYLACALPHSPLPWYYLWRLSAGITGSLLMILGPSNILRSCDVKIRSKVGGVVFSGIGIGVFIAGTLIPGLVKVGISFTWIALGVISLILMITTWNRWAEDAVAVKNGENKITLKRSQYLFLGMVLASYALNAIGYLPHTLFWVDYIVRELKMPLAYGGFFWAVFGIGAALGPFFTSGVAHRFGIKNALLAAFAFKAIGVFLPIMSSSLVTIFLSSLIVGAMTPGTVTLVALYTLHGAGEFFYRKAWNAMTLAFALSQAVFSYLMTYMVTNYFHTYRPLFVFSAGALLLSVICIIFTKPKQVY